MALALVRRSVKGSPLTAVDHDGNLTALETAIESGVGGVTIVTGTAPIAVATGTSTPVISITPSSGSTAGSMSSGDFSKLAGIQPSATLNDTNAALRDRATHTGVQAISTVTGLTTALALAVLSDVTGITGATRITNMVSLTQAQYNAITPNASTFYVII